MNCLRDRGQEIRVRFRAEIENFLFTTLSGQPVTATQTLIQRVVCAQKVKQAEHEVSHSHEVMLFTWRDLTVNTKIVRTIVRQFLPDVSIVLLANGK